MIVKQQLNQFRIAHNECLPAPFDFHARTKNTKLFLYSVFQRPLRENLRAFSQTENGLYV